MLPATSEASRATKKHPSSTTQTAIVYTDAHESAAAGDSLSEQVRAKLGQEPPDAMILFVSPRYDAKTLASVVMKTCRPKILVGCSSAGEFTGETQGEGRACAVAFRSSELKFSAGLGTGIGRDPAGAAKALASGFKGTEASSHRYCSALILTDALAGHADELIEQLTVCTGANYQFFGGGAGDDANFRKTQVILGDQVCSDAAVGLEILSSKPIGIGVRHGWRPVGEPMRVTDAKGNVLSSLDSIRAVEVFEEHARQTGQRFDTADPVPFFLHNILGVNTGQGYKLRVPLALNPEGAVICAAEIPTGALVSIMTTDEEAAKGAAGDATRDALAQLQGHTPGVAIFFDCVATRLRMGKNFGYELNVLKEVLGPTDFVGCNTYGQVARVDGQFNGFHNCTAVVCLIPS